MKKLLAVVWLAAQTVWGSGFEIVEENDVNFHTDRNYTQGLEFRWYGPVELSSDGFSTIRHIYGIRNLMYTPTDISIAAPQPLEHPWAGMSALTYTTWSHSFASDYTRSQWTVGVVGPWAQSECLQKWVHKAIGSPEPMGWSNQVPNEVIVNYNEDLYDSTWRIGCATGWSVDLSFMRGYAIGTAFVNGHAGYMARAGWDIPLDYNTGTLRPTATLASDLSAYVLGSVDGRLVLHNITLGGSLFQSGPSQSLIPVVCDISVGAAVELRHIFNTDMDLELSYTCTTRTREFTCQEDVQMFGSLQLGLVSQF